MDLENIDREMSRQALGPDWKKLALNYLACMAAFPVYLLVAYLLISQAGWSPVIEGGKPVIAGLSVIELLAICLGVIYLVTALSLVCFRDALLWRMITSRFLSALGAISAKTNTNLNSGNPAFNQIMQAYLILAAFGHTGAIYGLVLFLLTAKIWYLVLFGVASTLVMLFTFPSLDSFLKRLQQRAGDRGA